MNRKPIKTLIPFYLFCILYYLTKQLTTVYLKPLPQTFILVLIQCQKTFHQFYAYIWTISLSSLTLLEILKGYLQPIGIKSETFEHRRKNEARNLNICH